MRRVFLWLTVVSLAGTVVSAAFLMLAVRWVHGGGWAYYTPNGPQSPPSLLDQAIYVAATGQAVLIVIALLGLMLYLLLLDRDLRRAGLDRYRPGNGFPVEPDAPSRPTNAAS